MINWVTTLETATVTTVTAEASMVRLFAVSLPLRVGGGVRTFRVYLEYHEGRSLGRRAPPALGVVVRSALWAR